MTEGSPLPSHTLVEDIARFIQDVDSLRTVLPLHMQITDTLLSRARRNYNFFLEHKGVVKESNGDNTTYTVTIEHLTEFYRVQRERDSFRSAYRVIPRQFVISLVAQYDWFLGRLIHFLFAVKPEILNASERQLSYTDLVRFPDIANARTYIIEKEVETVIRKSHLEQFAWLKDKFNTPFTKDLQCLPIFVELTERRNLFVHADGIVSSQYMNLCREQKCDIPAEVKLGDRLEVDTEYFTRAYLCVLEIGIKMAHVIWRRLCPEELRQSDKSIINITYALIQQEDFILARSILLFFTQSHIKHGEDSDYRIMLLNLAQACKWSGDSTSCNRILGEHDWSACEDKFKLGVAALRNDYQQCYRLMFRLKHDPSFHKSFFTNWPIFKELRTQDEFKTTYEACYNETLSVAPAKEGAVTTNDKSPLLP